MHCVCVVRFVKTIKFSLLRSFGVLVLSILVLKRQNKESKVCQTNVGRSAQVQQKVKQASTVDALDDIVFFCASACSCSFLV